MAGKSKEGLSLRLGGEARLRVPPQGFPDFHFRPVRERESEGFPVSLPSCGAEGEE